MHTNDLFMKKEDARRFCFKLIFWIVTIYTLKWNVFNLHEKLIKFICYRNKIRRSMNMAKNATRSKATECLLNFEAVKVFCPYLSDKQINELNSFYYKMVNWTLGFHIQIHV